MIELLLGLLVVLFLTIAAFFTGIRHGKGEGDPNVSIRHTSKEHIPELAAMINEFVHVNKPDTTIPETKIAETELNRPHSFVKIIDGKVAGFISAELEGDTMFIWNVLTHVDFRGMGIASELIQHLFSIGDAKRYELSVSKKNPAFTAVKRLYEKNGFVTFSENDKEISMRKDDV